MEKYLARQKSAKERAAAQEKEVNRVLKQAEDVSDFELVYVRRKP